MPKNFELKLCEFDKNDIDENIIIKVLHPQEMQKIENCVTKRKAEFLAGRYCSKKALLSLSGKEAALNSILVQNDSFGAPFFSSGDYFVSIAHDNSLAAAIATTKENLKVGIDLEEILPKNSEVIFKFINLNEKELILNNKLEFGYDFLCAAVWVARESMSKLLGLGFSAFPTLETAGFEKQNDIFTVKFLNYKNFRTVIRKYKNHVIGFACLEKETGNFSLDNLDINCEQI